MNFHGNQKLNKNARNCFDCFFLLYSKVKKCTQFENLQYTIPKKIHFTIFKLNIHIQFRKKIATFTQINIYKLMILLQSIIDFELSVYVILPILSNHLTQSFSDANPKVFATDWTAYVGWFL